MVTHKPDDLKYVDRVIFLGTNGHYTFYGTENDMLQRFNQKDILGVYSYLGPGNEQNAEKEYIDWKTESEKDDSIKEDKNKLSDKAPENYLKQFYWLTLRYLKIKTNDRLNTLILLGQAPVIAFLTQLIFGNIILAVPFMIAISSIWFGVSNAAREIVGEMPIYRRERNFNLGIIPYISSKVIVLMLFALIQATIFIGIIYYCYNEIDIEGDGMLSWNNPVKSFVWMLLISFTSTMFGLLLSSAVKTTEQVMTLIPIVLIPQIMLAGIMAPIEDKPIEYISYATISRWGTEGFCIIQDSIRQSVPYSMALQADAKNDTTSQNNAVMKTDASISNIDNTENANKQQTQANQPDSLVIRKISAITNDSPYSQYGLHKSFHEDYQQSNIFPEKYTGTLELDAIFLIIMSIVFFIATFINLRSKDSL